MSKFKPEARNQRPTRLCEAEMSDQFKRGGCRRGNLVNIPMMIFCEDLHAGTLGQELSLLRKQIFIFKANNPRVFSRNDDAGGVRQSNWNDDAMGATDRH